MAILIVTGNNEISNLAKTSLNQKNVLLHHAKNALYAYTFLESNTVSNVIICCDIPTIRWDEFIRKLKDEYSNKFKTLIFVCKTMKPVSKGGADYCFLLPDEKHKFISFLTELAQ